MTRAHRARLLLLVGVGILALASAVISGRLRSSNQLQPQPVQTASNDPETIPLKVEGGTLLVPVHINGRIILDFTVDSGAADVSIPADVVLTLMRTGTLQKSDFKGQQTYRLADGSTVPSANFLIRSLKVGNHLLQDVRAAVAPVQGDLLLGQSFLNRFNSWSIDNKRQVLLLNPPSDRKQSAPSIPTIVDNNELIQNVMTEYYGSYNNEHSCWISNHGGTNYCMKPAHLDIVGSDANEKILIAVSGPKLNEDGQPEECHGCGGAMGLFVLAKSGSQFRVVAKSGLFEDAGEYGGAPHDAFSVRQLGPQGSYGWLIKMTYGGHGSYSDVVQIYGVVGDGVVSLGSVTTHSRENDKGDESCDLDGLDGPRCTDISGNLIIDANSPAGSFYPLVLRASGVRQGQRFEGTYRFVFDERALKYMAPQNMHF